MAKQLLDYTGKVVLITGGSTGIGRATAIAFARQGAKVAIGNPSDTGLKTVEEIRKFGGDAIFVKTDVSRAESRITSYNVCYTKLLRNQASHV